MVKEKEREREIAGGRGTAFLSSSSCFVLRPSFHLFKEKKREEKKRKEVKAKERGERKGERGGGDGKIG